MSSRSPVAFLSYVRSDDEHDGGRITNFRKRLEGEVKMQTGRPFAVFQDRNDILWGQEWEVRIKSQLAEVTFLIPIVTPSFFQSPACRFEFETFLLREKTFGINRLILPVVYVDCDQLSHDYIEGTDPVADLIRSRNYSRWQEYRFRSFDDNEVGSAIAALAKTVKLAIREVEEIIVVSKTADNGPSLKAPALAPPLVASDDVLSPSVSVPEEIFIVPSVRKDKKFDLRRYRSIILENKYYTYTNEFDETVSAKELSDPSDISKLYDYLSKFVNELRPVFIQMQEELEVSNKIDVHNISITILLDNSGSMRGRRIVYTASWLLLLAEWIEKLGMRIQVLGFTTRAWKGGQSREAWLQDGKPENPGRLNDVRHIVFKGFDESFLEAAISFATLVRDGLLKENIDGEAVLWATSSAIKSGAQINTIYVMSDGAPVDDSTLSINH